jgi:hypothetical protein
MTRDARKISGFILLAVPSIVYGGYFLLTVLSGNEEELHLTDFQKSMFRAGHAHAGVLVILALVAQLFIDHAVLSRSWKWFARIAFPLASILVSLGFFAGALGDQITRPTQFIFILYLGMALLTAALLTLGVGMVKEEKIDSNR